MLPDIVARIMLNVIIVIILLGIRYVLRSIIANIFSRIRLAKHTAALKSKKFYLEISGDWHANIAYRIATLLEERESIIVNNSEEADMLIKGKIMVKEVIDPDPGYSLDITIENQKEVIGEYYKFHNSSDGKQIIDGLIKYLPDKLAMLILQESKHSPR